MHRLLLSIAFLICATNALLAQNSTELERRNGFKDIKLGMSVDSLKGSKFKKEFKEQDEFPAKLYTVDDPEYSKIGEVDIKKIEIKAYKDRIYQIHVFTDKDSRVMKALESIYGIAEYDMKKETYFWKGQNMTLKFKSHSKHQIEMIYTSYPVLKLMKEDKELKVQKIAEDF